MRMYCTYPEDRSPKSRFSASFCLVAKSALKRDFALWYINFSSTYIVYPISRRVLVCGVDTLVDNTGTTMIVLLTSRGLPVENLTESDARNTGAPQWSVKADRPVTNWLLPSLLSKWSYFQNRPASTKADRVPVGSNPLTVHNPLLNKSWFPGLFASVAVFDPLSQPNLLSMRKPLNTECQAHPQYLLLKNISLISRLPATCKFEVFKYMNDRALISHFESDTPSGTEAYLFAVENK